MEEEKEKRGRPPKVSAKMDPPTLPDKLSVEGLQLLFPELDIDEVAAIEIRELVEMVIGGDSFMANKELDDVFFRKAMLFKKWDKVAQTFMALRRFDIHNMTESLVQQSIELLNAGQLAKLKPNQLVGAVEKLSKANTIDKTNNDVNLTFVLGGAGKPEFDAMRQEAIVLFQNNPKLLDELVPPKPEEEVMDIEPD